MSIELCKFQYNDQLFLKYRPSIISACATILAINICKREKLDLNEKIVKDMQEYPRKDDFFNNSKVNKDMKMELNTDIWNN